MSMGPKLDRREFVGTVGVAAVTAFLPLAVGAQSPVRSTSSREILSDWTIDDMWGVYPRYADPIGYGRAHDDFDGALEPLAAL